eukprot:gnl/MRDRNA2_/MRDRNA2_27990_c0_seq1.p1 gnl/MRDRNA2_/MRDRNA2_27990_c0~~gnl/MRDRNA2_/MRDRNA2_27990_c0_seq1.p1  ORF type:complete len:589 (-),score=115.20 gnl/MRDRNA2_/MRDRNA2_27990_c0_seq1:92-1858(-)
MVDWTKQIHSVELAEKCVSLVKGQPSNDGGKGRRRHSSLFKSISNIVCEGRHSRQFADLEVVDLCQEQEGLQGTLEEESPPASPSPARAKSQQGHRYRAVSRASSRAKDRVTHSAFGRMETVWPEDELPTRKKLFSPRKQVGMEVYAQDEMSDVEAIAWLTRAPSGCPTRQAIRSERDKVRKRMKSPTSKVQPRKWADASLVFKEAIPGSDYSPSRAGSSSSRSCCASPTNLSKKQMEKKCLVKMETKEISVIDEDPVLSLFESENLAKVKVRRGAVALSAVSGFTNKRTGLDSRWGKVKQVMIEKKKEEKRAEKGPNVSEAWQSVLSNILPTKQKNTVALTNAKRLNCEIVRRFFWGAVGNEHSKTAHEALEVLQQCKASDDQIDRLWRVWKRLDITRVGQVDSTAFLRLAHSAKGGDSRPGERAIRVLLDKKTHCTIDDVIQAIWPCATQSELEVVQKQLEELREGTREAETPAPPVLAQEAVESLVSNFDHLLRTYAHLDTAKQQQVGIRELVDAGLLDAEFAEMYFKRYGKGPSDTINCMDFCEMFCPDGFRATANSRTATDEDGNRLALSNGVWRSVSEPGHH